MHKECSISAGLATHRIGDDHFVDNVRSACGPIRVNPEGRYQRMCADLQVSGIQNCCARAIQNAATD